jgi:hypothetical protein
MRSWRSTQTGCLSSSSGGATTSAPNARCIPTDRPARICASFGTRWRLIVGAAAARCRTNTSGLTRIQGGCKSAHAVLGDLEGS